MVRQPLLGICILVVFISVPLVLGLVPVNPVYGVRTAATLADPDAWRRANAVTGCLFLLAAAASATLLTVVPGASKLWISVVLFTTPMAAALVVSFLLTRTAS